MQVDRVENWKKFSEHMERYIREQTVEKYCLDKSSGVDLISITQANVCVWNIMRYCLRIMNDRGKEHDLEKIAHYAELAWTISAGRSTTNSD